MSTHIIGLGDVHGSKVFMTQFYDMVVEPFKATHTDEDVVVVQVGDTTLAWGGSHVESFLDVIQSLVIEYGVPFYFIDGNHEDFYVLFEKYVQDETEDFVKLRHGVYYIPRGFVWEWDNVRFMGFGGAFSVNRDSLVKYVTWFPEELPTYSDITRALDRGKVDVLFSHECPLGVKHIDTLYDGMDIQESLNVRTELLEIVKVTQPELIVHGHHHTDYTETWEAPYGDVKVVGLSADYTHENITETYTILDTAAWN